MFMREKIEKGFTAIFLMLFMFVANHAFAQHSIEKHQTKTASSNSSAYDIIKHKVNSGDNLSGLAYRYKTTVKEIKQLNKLNREQVFLGETLKVPYNTVNAKGSKAFINYTIHKGDSLSVIAAKYKTDTKSIQIANNWARNQVNIGQKIVIPYNKKYESSDSFKTDVNNKVVSKATDKPKTIEKPVSNTKKIKETVQISEANDKRYINLETSIKKILLFCNGLNLSKAFSIKVFSRCLAKSLRIKI